jgi:uncharacterized RDD family membrane protein YckC
MSESATQNPFAPPLAHVQDQVAATAEMIMATRMSRFLAFLVDMSPALVLGVVGAIMVATMMPGLTKGHFDPQGAGLVTLGLLMLVFGIAALGWTIWSIVLVYRYGQTVGKKFLGIRVVRMDGSRVSFARFFFLRWLGVAVVGAIVGGIGGALHFRYTGNLVTLVDCLMIFGAARRCLHDLIADTRVVTAASSPHATLAGLSRPAAA